MSYKYEVQRARLLPGVLDLARRKYLATVREVKRRGMEHLLTDEERDLT